MTAEILMNVMMERAKKEMVAKAKRKLRAARKEVRRLKGRNTRDLKNKLCQKLGGERLQPRKMTLAQKAIYDYFQMFNKLPKCIRDQIDD